MRRWAFDLLAGVSVLLCVALCAIWVRSYFSFDEVIHRRTIAGHEGYEVFTVGWLSGYVLPYHRLMDKGFASSGIKSVPQWYVSSSNDASLWSDPWPHWQAYQHHWLGFGFSSQASRLSIRGVEERYAENYGIVPAWFLVLLFAVAPARWALVARRDRARRLKGCCRKCGYDVRATPASDGPLLDRCPECGHAIETPATMATGLDRPAKSLPP